MARALPRPRIVAVRAMRSTLQVGEPMEMTVRMSEFATIEQTQHIRVLEPGRKICWGIETPTPELDTGERGSSRYATLMP